MPGARDDAPQDGGAVHAWIVEQVREVTRTPIFRLSARLSRHPTDARPRAEFYVLEAPDWVNVIPLTRDRQVVMVRQYRHGRRETTLEIPGGMVDPGDPSPLEAARRELLEETGYFGRRLERIGAISPNPAIQANVCHSFVARDLELRGPPCPDGNEELTVELVALDRIPALIRDGEISHALVVVAFCHFLGVTVGPDTVE